MKRRWKGEEGRERRSSGMRKEKERRYSIKRGGKWKHIGIFFLTLGEMDKVDGRRERKRDLSAGAGGGAVGEVKDFVQRRIETKEE